jgi:hypothetical protein
MFKKIAEIFESISRARTAATLASMGEYEAARKVMTNQNLEGWV